MDKVLIADLGLEGGGATIYGRQQHGTWFFWLEGTSMDLDENDDEIWRSWSSQPVQDLSLVLPKEWPLFYPSKLNPEFFDWFRKNYDKHVRNRVRISSAPSGSTCIHVGCGCFMDRSKMIDRPHTHHRNRFISKG